jgi:Fe2+ or Zn2+ uptake regulation protein
MFNGNSFNTKDAFEVLNAKKGYSKGTVYRILHDLNNEGLIERLGRGIYRIHTIVEIKENISVSDKIEVVVIPGPLMKAKKLLNEKGIEFMITGESVLYRFHHHLPRRLIHLIYVIKGSGEYAVISLKEIGLRAILNPKLSEISMALDNFSERDFFVIREFSVLYGNVNGMASLERALVDLYFESTRKKIPYSEEEVGRIFSKVLRNERINISNLFMLASKRGIKDEIKVLLKFIKPEIQIEVKNNVNFVNKIIKAIEKEDLR